jgi:hypothetical protein
MLFGLSFDVLPDDDRDRVDMAVERMMPPDVELLMLIAEKRNTPPTHDPLKTGGKSNVFALINQRDLRLAVSDYGKGDGFPPEVLDEDRFRADRAALASLEAVGCIDRREKHGQQGDWAVYDLTITEVGYMVIRAIEEVRPGFTARR